MTDAFATAARAEAERKAPLDGHPAPALAQERAGLVEMAEWARDHLAAQEPPDAEVEALAVELSCRFYLMPGPELPWEGMDESERGAWRATTRSALSTARAALTAAKEAR